MKNKTENFPSDSLKTQDRPSPNANAKREKKTKLYYTLVLIFSSIKNGRLGGVLLALRSPIDCSIHSLDSKINELNNVQIPNETLSQLQQKLDSLDSKFEVVSRNGESNPFFASLLKNLERKLARLQLSLDRSLLRNSPVPFKSQIGEENFKLGPFQSLEELLMDIVTKIDVLYEKSTTPDVFDNPNEVRHLGKSCRMLAGPYKKLLASVDHLQDIIKELGINEETALNSMKAGELRNSVVQDIRESLENILDEIQVLRRKNEKNINENERILRRIDKKLDSELEDDDEDDEKLKKSLKKYMIEQRKILEKNLRKMLKDKDDDDDDDSDDDDDDDKRKNKGKKRGKGDDDDDDDDDSDDDDDDDDKKKKNKDDSDDDDDDDDDDDVECDDSDENGSKSCERENKKAYSRGKKKSKYDAADSDSDDDRDAHLKGKKKDAKKVRKDVREIEPLAAENTDDKLAADAPVQKENIWAFLGMHPPDVPTKQDKRPDVTP